MFIGSLEDLQSNLLEWFSKYGRSWIPWKLKENGTLYKNSELIDPYKIWIAEMMLQQTQLQVALPYWKKWMKTLPNLIDLTESDLHDVLMLWQGLGYYSRAKNVYNSSHLLLKLIGKDNSLNPLFWPSKIDVWMTLPGIGRSTAASIVSSAFDKPSPILDGNVKRILSRLIASKKTPTQNQQKLWELSDQLLSKKSPRNFNQALMDLGSMVCTRQNPNCSFCPLKNFCVAYRKYDPNDFPKKEMTKIKPFQEIGIGLVFNQKGELLIDQRLESSSMGGMWEFPGGKKNPDESIEQTIERELKEELGIGVKVEEKLLSFKHSYTHKKLYFKVHICKWISGEPKPLASQKLLWVSPEKLNDFPFPAANTKIISELHKHLCIGNKKL